MDEGLVPGPAGQSAPPRAPGEAWEEKLLASCGSGRPAPETYPPAPLPCPPGTGRLLLQQQTAPQVLKEPRLPQPRAGRSSPRVPQPGARPCSLLSQPRPALTQPSRGDTALPAGPGAAARDGPSAERGSPSRPCRAWQSQANLLCRPQVPREQNQGRHSLCPQRPSAESTPPPHVQSWPGLAQRHACRPRHHPSPRAAVPWAWHGEHGEVRNRLPSRGWWTGTSPSPVAEAVPTEHTEVRGRLASCSLGTSSIPKSKTDKHAS